MRPTLLFATLCAALIGHAAEPTRPNVLFITADDWGRGHAGAYGCSWVKTPNFDRVAKEGLLFLNAYTPTAKCTPSRSTILTGRHPWLLGAAANHQCVFPPEHSIFPDALEQHGYAYASTGKVWGPGLSLKADGSPRAMAGQQFNQKKAKAPTTGITNNDYSANFQAFLGEAVEVRGLHPRATVGTGVAVAPVVCDDEEDVQRVYFFGESGGVTDEGRAEGGEEQGGAHGSG